MNKREQAKLWDGLIGAWHPGDEGQAVRVYNRVLTDREIHLLASNRGIGYETKRVGLVQRIVNFFRKIFTR